MKELQFTSATTDPAQTSCHRNTCKIMILPPQPGVDCAEMAGPQPETVDQLLDISERVVGVTMALEKEPKDVGGAWSGSGQVVS